MVSVHAGVLGPANLSRNGVRKHLTPMTVKLLLRLIVAGGKPVARFVESLVQDGRRPHE